MKIYKINGKEYRLPSVLTDFQLKAYTHLIDWKWANICKDPGLYRGGYYDLFIPDKLRGQLHPLYPSVKKRFLSHQQKLPFKSHKFLGANMASSQAACANLFLPILEDPNTAAKVLSCVKEDLKQIATGFLDNGFRIEFWDEPDNMLRDHNKASGTDADMAIAYYDYEGKLNLWLIEHKLTEKEFTTCGGYKAKGRLSYHKCGSAGSILKDPKLCYYHSKCNYSYWDITLGKASPFKADLIGKYDQCPFKGGMNQLWRNQLLAASVESSESPRWPYKKVYFSVVYHPDNKSLESTISEYEKLIDHSDRFFAFTSDKLIERVKEVDAPLLTEWAQWYQNLYYL